MLKEVEEEYEEEKEYISYPKEEYIQNNIRNPPEKIQMYIIDNNKKDSLYLVKMVNRTILDNTSQYWSDEEVGGRICLFPTHKQKIYFEILEKI